MKRIREGQEEEGIQFSKKPQKLTEKGKQFYYYYQIEKYVSFKNHFQNLILKLQTPHI
jgi:hypothetical protein